MNHRRLSFGQFKDTGERKKAGQTDATDSMADAASLPSGRLKVKRLPFPGVLSTAIFP
jgi:hypothetical protein